MNTLEAIRERRSIRRYSDEPVSREDVAEVLEAGIWAPSGLNEQPWYFLALYGKDQVARLADVMEQVEAHMRPKVETRFPNHPQVVKETLTFVRQLGNAPVCILAFINNPRSLNKHDTIMLGIGASIQNILLAAADKGLGTCWLTAPAEAELGEALRDEFAPGKGPLVSMITLGYPDRTPNAPRRRDGRFDIVG